MRTPVDTSSPLVPPALAVLASLASLAALSSLGACSSTSSTGGDAGSDAAANADAPSAADAPNPTDAAKDQSTGTPVRCTQAAFDAPCSASGGNCTGPQNTQIDIAFPTTAAPAQYVNNCVKVKIGTDIDFAGDFTMHPLEPNGGDTPTPIPTQTTNPPNGTSGMPELVIKMTTAGTYGFQCRSHPSSMFGAIQVVP
jgi:plastocyanin